MEPISITSVYYILTTFVGYFVAMDFYNYGKNRQAFYEIKNELDEIKKSLNYLKNK